MGPEAVVGAFSQFLTFFMIVGLLIGGAARTGRALVVAVVVAAAALGIVVAIFAPVVLAGVFAFAVALVMLAMFGVAGRFLRKWFDRRENDKAA